MKRIILWSSVLVSTLVPSDLKAQISDGNRALPTAVRSKEKPETVTMNPFEVNTSRDTSYGALNSSSISAFNMELLKTPVAADIFTSDFMRDVATTTVEELLAGYGAGFGEVLPTPDSDANSNQPGDRAGEGPTGTRGVTAGATRRNGFSVSPTNANVTDTFDTERVEVVKGANALLFGASGAGGFVNTNSKQARFGSERGPLSTALVSSRIDQYGSKRGMLDANYGLKNLAFRFVVMKEDVNFRRLFLGWKTDSFYGTVAAKLPFNTIVRVTARTTDNDRITNTTVNDLSFTNATRDPRHNFSLPYLLATNQAGATNPKTGAAYPGGAIANGKLSWDNAASWGGWSSMEDHSTDTYTVTVDTVWTKWLATSVGAMYDHAKTLRSGGTVSLLAPRALNTANPLDEWASTATFQLTRDFNPLANRRHSYRAHALLNHELFNAKAKSQTVVGYDLNIIEGGGGSRVDYLYYEADSAFRVYDLSNPRPAAAGGTTGANQLGRIRMPALYWPVGSGPIKQPYFRIGSKQVTVDGRNYVLTQQTPRNPNWVTPTNPLGLITFVPGFTGIGGVNLGKYANYNKDYGLYGANYTRWFEDRFTTLFGYRLSKTFARVPNTNPTGTEGWREKSADSASSNLGITYRARAWLYAYYNIGKTYDPATRVAGDVYGNQPNDTEGFSQEVGFKYQPGDSRVSGSISYYQARSKNERFNRYSGTSVDLVNPIGLNDAFNREGRGNYVELDKSSSGLEVILTAAPTRNWRARLGFTQQEGKIKTAANYALLWNDEFYYDKASGGVTYSDGTPFIVPIDAAGVAAVNSASSLRTPTVGSTNTQLTVSMMSDRNSPYYAYGQGGTTEANGRITNNSVVFRALRWFQIPSGGQNIQARTLRTGRPVSEIPYVFGDPAGLQGVAVYAAADEPTVGHPLYRFVFTNTYEFSQGPLRGLTVGSTARWDLEKRTYWYTESDGKGGNIRNLYQEVPVNPQVNSFISYERRMGRYLFRTQMNVNNMFNIYKVELRPNGATGYAVENAMSATFVGEPRMYIWTNTVSF